MPYYPYSYISREVIECKGGREREKGKCGNNTGEGGGVEKDKEEDHH